MLEPLNDEFLLADELFPLFPNDPEITSLSTQLEKLPIEFHTHELQLRIERIKRQKMETKIKPLKREILNKNKLMQDMHAKIDQLKYEVEVHHMLCEGMLANLRTITFRCSSRSQ